MQYLKPYRIDALLSLLKIALDGDAIDHLHDTMEREIAMGSQRIERSTQSADELYQAAIIDDECYQTEELLGISFVIAQTFITRIRTRVADLAEGCKRDFRYQLTFVSDIKAYDILKRADVMSSDPSYSVIEAINAVANYWKHADEWPTLLKEQGDSLERVWDSANMRPNEKRTVEIMHSLGMSPSSTANLRNAAEMFGVTNYEDLSPIRKKVRLWAENLYSKACEEVSALKSKKN